MSGRSEDWRASAACGLLSADAWFVETAYLSAENVMALRVCQGCPVQAECDADSIAHPMELGAWIAGGRIHRSAYRTKGGVAWAASALARDLRISA